MGMPMAAEMSVETHLASDLGIKHARTHSHLAACQRDALLASALPVSFLFHVWYNKLEGLLRCQPGDTRISVMLATHEAFERIRHLRA